MERSWIYKFFDIFYQIPEPSKTPYAETICNGDSCYEDENDVVNISHPSENMNEWINGKPNAPGYYWIVQISHGGVYGPAIAYVYDGYPDDAQPPNSLKSKDPKYLEWVEKTKDLGKFLRIRTVEGFGSGDAELRKYSIDAYLSIERVNYPRK